MNHLQLIVRSLRGRPARNGLTGLGIAIGIGAFVAFMALAQSFTMTMGAMFASRRTDITVVRANSPDVLMSSLPEGLWQDLARVPGVAAAAPILAEMLWAEGQPASLVMGMRHDSYLLDHFKILEGRSLQADDQDVVLLGQTLARRMQREPGETYEIESYGFRVIGIYDAGNSLENSGAVVPQARFQWLQNREGEVTAVNLRVVEGASPAQVAEQIQKRFKNLSAVATSQFEQANVGLGLAQAMSLGTSLVALCIGLIGTLNAMMMTVLERTREMGLLRALGWRPWRVCLVLLGESLVLSVAGGLVGLLLGAASLRLVLGHPSIRGLLTAGLTPTLIAEAMGIALALGLLGGVLPALRGSRMAPTVALRHE